MTVRTPWCITMRGEAIHQMILPLCRAGGPSAPKLLPLAWTIEFGPAAESGGGLLTDLWSATINLGEIPVLRWTTDTEGLMKASCGTLPAATQHVYLCQCVCVPC